MLLKLLSKRLNYKTCVVRINGRKFNAIIADTMLKKMIGLMYRKSMKKDECMLFIFSYSSKYGIWMRNMLFPIDVVWLGKNKKVVDSAEGIKPCKTLFGCNVYKPKHNSLYVLEFRSGTIKKIQIKMGNTVRFSCGGITHSIYMKK